MLTNRVQAQLHSGLHQALMTAIQPTKRADIPRLLDAIGLPAAFDNPELSKAKYIESRFELVNASSLLGCVESFLQLRGNALPADQKFELEETLWDSNSAIIIPKRTRYDVARAVGTLPLYLKRPAFLELVFRCWNRETTFEALLDDDERPLMSEIKLYLARNPEDRFAENLFEQVGAFGVSDRRFCIFIEGLASAELRPDETSQREFVAAVNAGLQGKGVELREVGTDGGFPVFRFANVGHSTAAPKNLIFASTEKPDLRFRDALNNDIEILSSADKVLVYDRPFPAEGLRWRDLQEWWADLHGLDEEQAKRSLYSRLLEALPQSSPPQRLLFKTFYSSFPANIQKLPALLPEVWLHWDPRTVRARGVKALARSRMDFLMLFSHEVRVVIEVDGRHHYANEAGTADPVRYAKMVKADRELQFDGYEVYRFGAVELVRSKGSDNVKNFFTELFKRHRVPL